ncbi:MAG: hypothetical protein O7F17_00955 [Planctomycetota bacterium]|nr:hypothetical protein [Planctomycetota bacterium]MCZ6850190.1 hypothetical protein [Planctomycetota bacterium]
MVQRALTSLQNLKGLLTNDWADLAVSRGVAVDTGLGADEAAGAGLPILIFLDGIGVGGNG